MQTSYFKKSFDDPKSVSISLKSPSFFKGREYKKLAPPYWLLKKYKEDGDEKFYTEKYYEEVLNKLDPKEIYEELGENSILLCWESSEKFCHRHIVSEWFFKNLGIFVKECNFDYNEANEDDEEENFKWGYLD